MKKQLKIISTYGSIENLIKNAHELKGKLKENVENFAEQAILSKQLATIILDCPVEFDESDFSRKEVNEKELVKLLQYYQPISWVNVFWGNLLFKKSKWIFLDR